jgi:hypothetical protein
MHLVGNGIFLVAVGAAWWLCAHSAKRPDRRGVSLMRAATLIEAFHILEHSALTITVLPVGRPIGLSTGFGELDPGPALWTYRIWWHLVFNLTPVILAGIALIKLQNATLTKLRFATYARGST